MQVKKAEHYLTMAQLRGDRIRNAIEDYQELQRDLEMTKQKIRVWARIDPDAGDESVRFLQEKIEFYKQELEALEKFILHYYRTSSTSTQELLARKPHTIRDVLARNVEIYVIVK